MEKKENMIYVIVRTENAGVHLGYIKEDEIRKDLMNIYDVRRIWSWSGAMELNELATLGSSDPKNCQISVPVSRNMISPIEILTVSERAKKVFDSIPCWLTDGNKKNITETNEVI